MTTRVSNLCKQFLKVDPTHAANFSSSGQLNNKLGQLLISCKRKVYNHYSATHYGNLDEVPLISKGWNHSKSKGDFFTVLPLLENLKEVSHDFKACGICPDLIEALKTQDIEKATDFQSKAISSIQSGNHTLLAAETGCGKTLSYLLPIIQNLAVNKAKEMNMPRALVIVPNRELAYQVGDVATILAEAVGLKARIVVGGRTKKIMMDPTFEEIDILVATPGALGKLSTVGVYKLNEVQYTVLDEADTLIDDSFIERMNGILKRVSQSQIILVSATLPKDMPDILSPIEPLLQHVVSPKIHRPLLNITQKFLRLTRSDKPSNLLQIAKNNNEPMLVFSNKNETCNWIALFLRENGVTCANINGDMNYAIRIEQWNQFVQGKTKILSATDVGSRGLNTIQVKQLLNYDFPFYAADYLHRIGRIGRIGSPDACKATNFVTGPREVALLQQIELAIRRNQPLTNVDGNITNIVQRHLARQMRDAA